MKVLLLTLALLGIAAQEPTPFPPGQYCVHATVRDPHPAHPCNCHRECHGTEDEQGHPQQYVQEDPQCKQYCSKEHCHCPVHNCD